MNRSSLESCTCVYRKRWHEERGSRRERVSAVSTVESMRYLVECTVVTVEIFINGRIGISMEGKKSSGGA